MQTIGEQYGYKLLRRQTLPELDAVLWHLQHERTGLELVWLDRPDDNKTFAITFRTLPWNDTGVFHILEHSVLNGSVKYPVKAPFVELVKSSMNTFLNAMTFPDRTVYPVSSRNGQDFMNLVHVYLDAVFCPLIYSRPEIFAQEGWHYEISEDGEPGYNGVVFNEMKGVFADADSLLDSAVNRALFPANTYRFVSGGDPVHIPELSYEDFVGAHRKFYAPSNAYVFLDGAVDPDAVFGALAPYLDKADRTERLAPPALQPPVVPGEQTLLYEIAPDEPAVRRCRLARCSVIGTYAQRERIIGAQILAEVLCGGNEAPLSSVILSRGLAEKVTMQVQDGTLQPSVCLEIQGLRKEDRTEVETLLQAEIQRLVQDSIDRQQLTAALTNMEFQMRERDYGRMPKGLIFCFNALESWLYGGEPSANLEVGDLFEQLKAFMEQGFFEQLLRELFLESKHCCTVWMLPSGTLGEQRRKEEKARLHAAKTAWTADDIARLRTKQEQLMQWQNRTDTPGTLAMMPVLTRGDIDPEPPRFPLEQREINGLPVLVHELDSGGIVYTDLYFDAGHCSEQELSALSFCTCLFGKLGTKEFTAAQVRRQSRLLCGALGASAEVFSQDGAPEHCKVMLHISFSTLKQNLEPAVRLVCGLLTGTDFTAQADILDLLHQEKRQLFQYIVMNGHAAALTRVSAQNTAAGAVSDAAGGIGYYRWLCGHENGLDTAFLQKLAALWNSMICLQGLTLSMTGPDLVSQTASLLSALLPAASLSKAAAVLRPWGLRKESILIPADISFAVQGGSLLPYGGGYTGEAQVGARILSLAYLWNNIRVQGGAYGTGLLIEPEGTALCYSYRDPDAARSLQVYAGVPDFLRNFCSQGQNLTGFLIGAASDASPLLTPRAKGLAADRHYFCGRTWEKRLRFWQQMLYTGTESLCAFADALDSTMKQAGICVVASEAQAEKLRAWSEVSTL